MKLKDFNTYFIKYFKSTLVTHKKPPILFKNYLLTARTGGYYCLNFVEFFTLLRRLVFFIQAAISNKTSISFFFETAALTELYASISAQCSSLYIFTPRSFRWLSSWLPTNRDFVSSNSKCLYDVSISSLSIFCEVSSLVIPSKLANNNWPMILCLPITTSISSELNVIKTKNTYFLPTQKFSTISNLYFTVSFFGKVILYERKRRLL